ncbi:Uncharacterised protein [Legionella busanensis]|uniref:Uncharacterized protein n=1 Tax=Legionella busanensis TaxID=190655 RepID=A0A378JK52_9GAMM|nr:hypothetical protein [Legionella busanensis]STX51068.1 Uncharacterised protein [Legionella busanensis]
MRQNLQELIARLPKRDKEQLDKLNPKLKSLLFSNHPERYLLTIGLDFQTYKQTNLIPEQLKILLLENILNSTSAEDTLKIIHHLLKLEFQANNTDPIRSGNRLIGLLMRSFIAKEETQNESEYFNYERAVNYTNFQKNFNARNKDKKLQNYVDVIPDNVKRMWLIMQKTAELELKNDYPNFAAKGLVSTPPFHYTQMLPANTLEEARANALEIPVVTTAKEGEQTLKELTQGVTLPVWVGKNKDMQDKLKIEVTTFLNELKADIKKTSWQVAGFGIFKGGLINEGQRVPHRVDKILNTIKQFEERKLDAVSAYDDIVGHAQEALISPRRGQHKTTTNFYQKIANHNWLATREELTVTQLSL